MEPLDGGAADAGRGAGDDDGAVHDRAFRWGALAQNGIAGARVDRITTTAGVNNALLYRYFGSKLDLFDTVYTRLVTETVDDVPLDPRDLTGYTAALFDYYVGHPEVVRLTAWRQLERPDHPLPVIVTDSYQDKTDRIAAAQRDGAIPDRVPADELLALVIHLSLSNTTLGLSVDTPIDHTRRRETITEAVRALLAP
ncbi:TetR family transcriptional regulator [Streptomyces sp. NPDC004610]|uniref:TetR family transcriptional regulator n=1 Tax=unclassified Streptomyces TaxID=2593676 RepID=UPI0033A010C7